MKTIEKNIIGIILLFVFYICFASCNGNMEQKLDKIQDQLDSIEKEFKIERSTYNAMASSSFKDFVKLSYMHGVFNDPTYFDEEEFEDPVEDLVADFIDEIIDQNLVIKDTIITTYYKICFQYETDSNVILRAESEDHHYQWKFIISKGNGDMKLGFWDREDYYDDLPSYVKEKEDILMITTEKVVISIPQFQTLQHYESRASAAGYSCHKCDSYILLSIPKMYVSLK